MRGKVAATRLSEPECAQVAAAAARLGESVSAFTREALLAASARVTGRVSEQERDELPITALEPVRHMVDGEWTGRYLA